MVKELQSLALDIRILNHNMEEIDLDASFDDDDDTVSDEIIGTMEEGDVPDTLSEDDLDDANMLLEDDDMFDNDLSSDNQELDDYDDTDF